MSTNSIYLLVRADDIGAAHSVNLGCIQVFTQGICRSVEIMPVCPWFPEAVTLLQQHQDFDVGVHLVMTSEWDRVKWRPLTQVPSLVTEDGYFYSAFQTRESSPNTVVLSQAPWKLEEIAQELEAQIKQVLTHLPWASHLTFHMGGVRLAPEVKELVDRLALDYNLAVDPTAHGFERFRGFGENNQTLTAQEKTAHLAAGLEALGPGKWLFVDHPALDTLETQGMGHPGYENVAADRQGVVDAWTDKQVLEIIARRNIQLVSYADIKANRIP